VGTTALRLVYNYVIMAPYYPIYRLLELRRLARSAAEAAGQPHRYPPAQAGAVRRLPGCFSG